MQFLRGIKIICLAMFVSVFLISILSSVEKIEIGPVEDGIKESNITKVLIDFDHKPRVFKVFKLKEKNKTQITQEVKGIVAEENITEFTYTDLIAAEVNAGQLKELKKNPYIKEITNERVFSAVLSEAVEVINASISWPLKTKINNLNLTGLGQTVCVLDTGINYSHADLSSNYVGGWDFVNDDNDPYDDNGHGTHVSGIIAANGGITGIAPDTKIVSIKVLDNEGNGGDADIISGIEWCIGNSSNYNISIISMSIGSNALYDSYCNDDSLASSVDAAIAQNISFVVSSGNDGNYTHIASPACVQNSTAVGMAYDENFGTVEWLSGGDPLCTDNAANESTLVCWGNRNSLIDFVAPGAIINSTTYDGVYGETQGTSMSAPMISGAISIIKQYLNSSSQLKTPFEIETTLNNTGLSVRDLGSSSLNYTRIDLYGALISLDIDSPNVSLISPIDNYVSESSNQTFSCNTSDWQLNNVSFYLWNSSLDLINNTFFSASGTNQTIEINITNLNLEEHKWNCYSCDAQSNCGFASLNYTLSLGNLTTSLNSPLEIAYTNTNQTIFNCSSRASSIFQLTNTSLYLWNASSGLVYNQTVDVSGPTNESIFYYNLTNQGNYSWNCLSSINNSQQIFAISNYSLVYDGVAPNITLVSPGNGAAYSSNSQSITFSYNINETENNFANCSLIINSLLNQTNTTITNLSKSHSFIETFSTGTYNWRINCTDKAINIGNSSSRQFTITAPATQSSSSSGGGGGGGGGATIKSKTYSFDTTQVSNGISQNLKKDDKINFEISTQSLGSETNENQSISQEKITQTSAKHSLTVNKITNLSVSMTIQSDPIKLTLYLGQDKKLNLSSGEYYDLYVKLNSIKNTNANITLKEINEPMPGMTNQEELGGTNKNNKEDDQISIEITPRIVRYIMAIILVILIVIVIRVYLKNKKQTKKQKTKKKKVKKKTKNRIKK
jgi:subtilisin family serine protease